MMEVIYSILLVLSALHSRLIVRADKKFGCFFEADVCNPYEICVNDGIFGRCQLVTAIDVFKYEVSPNDLQRLRDILQELSLKGLMWHDEATQQVIAKELSNLHLTRHLHPETGSSDSLRATKQKMASEENYEGAEDGDLQRFKSLHQYLQFLSALSQPDNPMPSHKTRTDKSEAIQSSSSSSEELPPRVQGRVPSDHFPASHHPYTGKKHQQPQLFSPVQQQDPPGSEALDKAQLAALLEDYMARKLAVQSAERGVRLSVKPDVQSQEALAAPRKEQEEGPNTARGRLPDWEMDDQHRGMKEERMPRKPSRISGKDPLSYLDENFIRSVVQQLGTQHVDLDGLTSNQLDALSSVIADALQVVDNDRTKEGDKSSQEAQQKEEEGTINRDEIVQGKQADDLNERISIQRKIPHTEEMSSEEKQILTEVLGLDALYINSHKNQVKRFGFSSSGTVGIENVKSNTITREVSTARKSKSGIFGLEDGSDFDNQEIDGNFLYKETQKKNSQLGDLSLDVESSKNDLCGYIVTEQNPLSVEKGVELMEDLAHLLKLQMNVFSDVNMVGPAVTFQVDVNGQNLSTADVVDIAVANKGKLEKETGLKILQTGMGEKSKLRASPHWANEEDSTKFIILTIISIVCIIGVLVASGIIYCLRHRSHHKLKEKLSALGHDATVSSDATNAYQELCRQRMAIKTSERPETAHASRINSVSSQFSDGPQPSPSTRSSTSSWCEEPVQSNMDISTGHMILSYMEDHLRNKNRLVKEWEALSAYQAEPNNSSIADREENEKKNRTQLVVPYDHSRITLKAELSHSNSDYINASPIMDHDPRNPAYIASQGPLPATVADFWQMVWEHGCVVIVMLTPLTENGVQQCHHYWPDEGSNLYHIYEVNLVSEHIWCEDFLVRSFYLKNLQTNETRTVTQFHFLSWFDQAVPSSTRSLLDFRRKVNKCYRGRSCPIIVHCSDGAGRTGTYILIDMVLNRMGKGAKEIDIAATLEHLRDQRPMMVQTKEQFEFALTAVAEEVNAILKALLQ
ncbi:receptor-type tyrosine-protein phosphatase N2 isoform X2 [Pristis pectinata]|uniref:receptor-type tyrosine-protein phosphatase N2 isoform X2 n=1 Tax=Pristis pectinata TaxID=685728 RepID=UPI00223E462B|nr:receptor-type tyrosine-protein phosphatase N2 isoform X2 [Pristis pectinata]